jgi:hypothetical protein
MSVLETKVDMPLAELQALVGSKPEPELEPENRARSVREIIEARMRKAAQEEAELQTLLPKEGYFSDYTQYTLDTEAPLAYHVWAAIVGVAAVVNRKVYIDMGKHRLYPPLGVFLLGESGIKKTTCGDILVGLLRELRTLLVYSEKLTPEALLSEMAEGSCTGLVYAPEMTVLLSKQKYMESIIPILTRLMDCPDKLDTGTIMRGKVELHHVGITVLMCSTVDWFTKNTPEAVFGGGFIARNIMVLQDISSREFPLPPPDNTCLRAKLVNTLGALSLIKGTAFLSSDARAAHLSWDYENKRSRIAQNNLFDTYFSRKPAHLLRVALCLHLGTHPSYEICLECWDRARAIMAWTEQYFGLLNSKMFQSEYGNNQELVLRTLQRAGGTMNHNGMLRELGHKLPAAQVKLILSNLQEAGLVRERLTALSHFWELEEEDE